MPKKDKQKRLTVPFDVWHSAKFDYYDTPSFGFFITDDSRVIIMDTNEGKEKQFEFLGRCSFDNKHRCFVTENVDTYLGEGELYYFTTHICNSGIYIYKLDKSICQTRQSLQIQALLALI